MPLRDAAVAVESDPLARNDTDIGRALAADSAQNCIYLSLPYQSGAAAGKSTHRPFVYPDLVPIRPKQCSSKEPTEGPADDPDP